MMVCDILLPKELASWKSCFEEEFPLEDRMETMVFKPFFAKGFGCPREPSSGGRLLHYYGLEASHLKPWRRVTSNQLRRFDHDVHPLL
jgi:hypothetical protein